MEKPIIVCVARFDEWRAVCMVRTHADTETDRLRAPQTSVICPPFFTCVATSQIALHFCHLMKVKLLSAECVALSFLWRKTIVAPPITIEAKNTDFENTTQVKWFETQNVSLFIFFWLCFENADFWTLTWPLVCVCGIVRKLRALFKSFAWGCPISGP